MRLDFLLGGFVGRIEFEFELGRFDFENLFMESSFSEIRLVFLLFEVDRISGKIIDLLELFFGLFETEFEVIFEAKFEVEFETVFGLEFKPEFELELVSKLEFLFKLKFFIFLSFKCFFGE